MIAEARNDATMKIIDRFTPDFHHLVARIIATHISIAAIAIVAIFAKS